MGHINIKLADLICEKGESKNKVCYHCEIQRTQLNNYCNNKVSRVDLALMAESENIWTVISAQFWNM